MKSVVKNGLSVILLTSLVACSSSDSRRQASSNFDYLETPSLKKWQTLPDQKQFTSNQYAIPQGNYHGEVGKNVDIRPPQQLLVLIPGVRFQRQDMSVYVWMPSDEIAQGFSLSLKQRVNDKTLPVTTLSDVNITTNWVELSEMTFPSTGQGRFLITPVESGVNYGFKIDLVDWKNDITLSESETGTIKNQALTQFVNQLLFHYDEDIRAQAREKALELVKKIPITLGSDRSGLKVIIARVPYDVMWERIPSILMAMGFSIEDRNRSQGTLEVEYSNPGREYWDKLGVPMIDLNGRKFKLLLGDLGNRTSINFTDFNDKPLSDNLLEQLSVVMSKNVEQTN